MEKNPGKKTEDQTEYAPFLNWKEELFESIEDAPVIFHSLVAMTRDDYPFDEAQQKKAVNFLYHITPGYSKNFHGADMINTFLDSTNGSHTEFIDTVMVLLSSSIKDISFGVLGFLDYLLPSLAPSHRFLLSEGDLIPKIMNIIKPHTLPLDGNELPHTDLVSIVNSMLFVSTPTAVDYLARTYKMSDQEIHSTILKYVIQPATPYLKHIYSSSDFAQCVLSTNFRFSRCHMRTQRVRERSVLH
ncbi:hypothetical protein BLNAU_9084 [Blattamonas nauphoetae]|uniref:Uncharacterized protein n=1 Tax=Blattamonas nauphoetae TaxID=2049346 RepID=A0ABQ9XWS7_9EUKA|nr:hypothetical protein BLNAU_9084 [Blattamonas nauphoetae]